VKFAILRCPVPRRGPSQIMLYFSLLARLPARAARVRQVARQRATHDLHRPYLAPKKRWVKVAMKLISISRPITASRATGIARQFSVTTS
jgi:hypothetical protein